MTVLPITEDIHAQVRRVVEYATAPANHYTPKQPHGKKLPTDNPNHVVQLHQYRCVFSITVADGKAWRHLSISVRERGQFAAPIVALTLAKLFGFTGWDGVTPKPPSHWTGTIDRPENAVLLFQEYKEERIH